MTLTALDGGARAFWMGFTDSAVRTMAVATVAAIALIAWRRRRPGTRLAVWTVVLGVAFAMPVMSRFLPAIPVPVPRAWLDAEAATLTPPAQAPIVQHREPAPAPGSAAPPVAFESISAQPAARRPPSWALFAATVYLVGAALLLLRMAVGWRTTSRFERQATTIADPRVRARLEHLARTVGLGASRLPRLRDTPALFVPITMGLVRPAIVLPSAWRTWDAETLDAVLVHELSHIARRDGLTQALSLLYRALTWCAPLAWWLHRHLVELGEQASDDAVLATGVDRASYADMLMTFVAAIQGRPRRAAWTVAMATGASVERRVERLLNWSSARGARPAAGAIVAVVIAGTALGVVAAAIHPAAAPSIRSTAPERHDSAARDALATPATVTVPQPAHRIPPSPSPEPRAQVVAPANSRPQVMVVLFDLDDASVADREAAVKSVEQNITNWRARFVNGLDSARVWRFATMAGSVDLVQDFTGDRSKTVAALAAVTKQGPTRPANVQSRMATARAQCEALAQMPNDGTFFRDTGEIGAEVRLKIDIGTMAPFDWDSRVRGLWHVVAGAPIPGVDRAALASSCRQQNIVFEEIGQGRTEAPSSQAPAASPSPTGRRLIAMFFDINSLTVDRVSAVDFATRFIDSGMRQTDRIGVITLSNRLETIQTYTENASFLKSALGRVRVMAGATPDRTPTSAVASVCADMGITKFRNDVLAKEGLTAGRFTEVQLLFFSSGVDRGTMAPIDIRTMVDACSEASVSFMTPDAISLLAGPDLARTLAMGADVIQTDAVIGPAATWPFPASGVTLSFVPHQAGAPVTLTRSTHTLDSGYASAVIRNDSAKPIRAVTLAALVRDGAPVLPSPSVLTASSAAVTIQPGDSLEIATRLIDGAQLNALARHGASAELGVVEIEFVDGSKWTYDVKAKGQFER